MIKKMVLWISIAQATGSCTGAKDPSHPEADHGPGVCKPLGARCMSREDCCSQLCRLRKDALVCVEPSRDEGSSAEPGGI